jgi:Uma2 family endonuclease
MTLSPPRVRRPLMGDELLRSLGGIPACRVCFDPPPGQATEADLLEFLHAADKRLFELVDGTLVEKPVGYSESSIASILIRLLGNWSHDAGDLGNIAGEAGTVRLLGRQVRMPDVSFTRWDRLPGGLIPPEPIPDFAADLAVEVLSESNTPAEIDRKLGEYFACGAKLAWVIDPESRTARAYTSPANLTELTEADALDGGGVLPGFRLPLADLFAKLPPPDKPKRPEQGRG